MKSVKILGSGCANCRKLEAVAREAASGAGTSSSMRPSTSTPRRSMSASTGTSGISIVSSTRCRPAAAMATLGRAKLDEIVLCLFE